jgi:hypothetical protein
MDCDRGNPLDDITLLQDAARRLLIMQGSYAHKKLLASRAPAPVGVK